MFSNDATTSEFFIFEAAPDYAAVGYYSAPLVLLSYVIACLGSFAALRLVTHMREAATPRHRVLFHLSGALTLGAGIWSMHFIGMLAYKMDMVHTYDPLLTAVSMLIAAAVAYGVFQVLNAPRLSLQRVSSGAMLLGLAICAMHYVGMAAMEMDADLRYQPSLFLLSVLIAMTASGAALWIVFMLARDVGGWKIFLQATAALVMGAAICGMHYTGMAAAVFLPYADCRFDPNQSYDSLVLAVTLTSCAIFAGAVTLSLLAGGGGIQQADSRSTTS